MEKINDANICQFSGESNIMLSLFESLTIDTNNKLCLKCHNLREIWNYDTGSDMIKKICAILRKLGEWLVKNPHFDYDNVVVEPYIYYQSYFPQKIWMIFLEL